MQKYAPSVVLISSKVSRSSPITTKLKAYKVYVVPIAVFGNQATSLRKANLRTYEMVQRNASMQIFSSAPAYNSKKIGFFPCPLNLNAQLTITDLNTTYQK